MAIQLAIGSVSCITEHPSWYMCAGCNYSAAANHSLRIHCMHAQRHASAPACSDAQMLDGGVWLPVSQWTWIQAIMAVW